MRVRELHPSFRHIGVLWSLVKGGWECCWLHLDHDQQPALHCRERWVDYAIACSAARRAVVRRIRSLGKKHPSRFMAIPSAVRLVDEEHEMSQRQGCFVVVLCLYVSLTLATCKSSPSTPGPVTTSAPVGAQPPDHGAAAPTFTVNLSVSGGCVQKVSGNTVHWVGPLDPGNTVGWTAPSATPSCQISFNNNQNDCPFFSTASNQCSNRPCTGGSLTSAGANGQARKKYPYSAWSIGGTNCPVGSDGLIMR